MSASKKDRGEWETNRSKKLRSRTIHSFWCDFCDRDKLLSGSRCNHCHVRDKGHRIKDKN